MFFKSIRRRTLALAVVAACATLSAHAADFHYRKALTGLKSVAASPATGAGTPSPTPATPQPAPAPPPPVLAAAFVVEGAPATSQSFPLTAVGSYASSDILVRLKNSGTASGSADIPTFQSATPDDFTATGCTDVPVEAACEVRVRFKPASAGNKSAQLTLAGVSFTFTGTGVTYGEGLFTTPGTYYWVAPANVTSVSVVAIGGGGGWQGNPGGGGGGLGYRNNIAVTPGAQYVVVVGKAGGSIPGTNGESSYFHTTSLVSGGGGKAGGQPGYPGAGGGYVGQGGGTGGAGGDAASGQGGGGGGAGGYAGPGGKGGSFNQAGSPGQGGGGGGAGGGTAGYAGGIGGGVDVYGIGTSGTGGVAGVGVPGQHGSYVSGAYGSGTGAGGARGGAVRIIWGPSRSFPNNAR